jgi:hypothetical protein
VEELREEAATAVQRAEFEACLEAAAHGDDCTDRLAAVLRAMGQEVEAVRGGYAAPPELTGGKGAVLKAVCPNSVCSRTEPTDAPQYARRCAIQGLPMQERWVPPA